MNNQNEQCYQLAISSRTKTIETVVLFTFREMIINNYDECDYFVHGRPISSEIHISPPEIYWGSV